MTGRPGAQVRLRVVFCAYTGSFQPKSAAAPACGPRQARGPRRVTCLTALPEAQSSGRPGQRLGFFDADGAPVLECPHRTRLRRGEEFWGTGPMGGFFFGPNLHRTGGHRAVVEDGLLVVTECAIKTLISGALLMHRGKAFRPTRHGVRRRPPRSAPAAAFATLYPTFFLSLSPSVFVSVSDSENVGLNLSLSLSLSASPSLSLSLLSSPLYFSFSVFLCVCLSFLSFSLSVCLSPSLSLPFSSLMSMPGCCNYPRGREVCLYAPLRLG